MEQIRNIARTAARRWTRKVVRMNEIRLCNLLGWAYCDGDCEKCRTTATTQTTGYPQTEKDGDAE